MQQGFVITLMQYLFLIRFTGTVKLYRFFYRARAPVFLNSHKIFTSTKQL